jgi:hypothetical protein
MLSGFGQRLTIAIHTRAEFNRQPAALSTYPSPTADVNWAEA